VLAEAVLPAFDRPWTSVSTRQAGDMLGIVRPSVARSNWTAEVIGR
jgi:hypothetical protein